MQHALEKIPISNKTLPFLWLEYIQEELDWLDTVANLAQEQEVSHDHIGNIGIK